jgi:hypothetical protein
MQKDHAISLILKRTRTEGGRGRQLAIVAAAVLAVVILIGVVVAGFRGRQVPQNAASMTIPATNSANAWWRPWWVR